MSNRSRLTTVLLVSGALAGLAACGRSEPTTAFPRSSASSGSYQRYDTAAASTQSNDPMNSSYRASGSAVGSTNNVAPGNGPAGFDNGLNGNGVNQGGQGMGGYANSPNDAVQFGAGTSVTTPSTSPSDNGSSAPPASPTSPGAIDQDPMSANASSTTGIRGNTTTGRNTGTSTAPTGSSNRPRTSTGTAGSSGSGSTTAR